MTSQSGSGMEIYTIAGVRYEIPSAVAEMLHSSKSHLQITVFNPKSTRFIEYCAGVGSIGEKEKIDASGVAVEGVAVIEEVKTGGCACDCGFMEGEEEEVEIVDAVPVRNPEGVKAVQEGVVDSDDTNFLFDCSEEKVDNEKDVGENSVAADMYAANKLLGELVEMGKVAQFKESEEDNDVDCEIVQSAPGVSKRKKKDLPLRIQPTRETGKRKQAVKEESAPARLVKRQRRSKSGKEILLEVECSEEFLEDEGLTEVLDLLKAQGWENLCKSRDFVCPEAVEDFYKDLKLIDEPVPTLEVNFRGNKFTLSSTELAEMMGLEHEGFDYFCKSSVWPKEVADKLKLVKRICKLKSVPKGSGLSTQFMEPTVKILHKLLVSNFMQRGVKPSYVQHQDLLLLDKMLNKEKINLPKLMIHQIDHLKNLTQIGYSRVVKKVLEEHNLYEVSSGVEEQIVKEFDHDVFRKMNLVKDQVEGWIKAPVQEPKLKAKPALKIVEEEEDSDESEATVDKKVAVLELNISEMKSDIKEIKAAVKKMTVEIKGVQDALMALIEKL